MTYTDEQQTTMLEAIETLGETHQLELLQEECGELVAAINRYKRGRIEKETLATEVADVLIMAYQARFIVDEGLVDLIVRQKIARLAKRLEECDARDNRE